MIVVIAGCNGNQDLSGMVDRTKGLEANAILGNRIDTLSFMIHDPNRTIVVPPRAEIVMYDADPATLPGGWTGLPSSGSPIVDPPSGSSSTWTPRLFGGYVATRKAYLSGAERYWDITAQDYTVRIKQTVANRAYGPDTAHPSGWTDGQVVRDIFGRYLSDIDVSLVQDITPGLPPISFPTHTVEQFMARIIKISRAVYRLNYYKQLTYGMVGTTSAPFAISDAPNNGTGSPATFGCENLEYDPDDSALFNRVWVIGGQLLGNTQSIRVGTGDGNVWTFPLPAPVDKPTSATVTVGGVDQGNIGVIPTDGTLDNRAGFQANAIVGAAPPVLAFQNTPAAGAAIVITAQFRYPLIQIVSDPTLIAAMGGKIFEYVLRDKRITSQSLAILAGQQAILTEGYTRSGGSCVVRKRGWGGRLLEPGQVIGITNVALFQGGVLASGGSTFNALIKQVTLRLDDDTVDPYEVSIGFADRP